MAGANVTLACRNQDKAEQARAKIEKRSSAGSAEIGALDLEDLDSVRSFAETYIQQHNQLDVLINNAGVGTRRRLRPVRATNTASVSTSWVLSRSPAFCTRSSGQHPAHVLSRSPALPTSEEVSISTISSRKRATTQSGNTARTSWRT